MGGAVVAGFVEVQSSQSQTATANPELRQAFTVEQTEVSQSKASGRQAERRLYYALRSDRSTSKGPLPHDPSGVMTRVVLSVPLRLKVQINDKAGIKSTENLVEPPAIPPGPMKRRGPGERCEGPQPNRQYIGDRSIAGTTAHGYRFVTEHADRTVTRWEVWYAPAVGCYVLETHAELVSAEGAVQNVFDRSTTRLVLGEPDPGLFVVPAHYLEVPPSQLEKRSLAATAEAQGEDSDKILKSVPSPVVDSWARRDAEYSRSKTAK
jgi:hypothetical protein